MSTYSGSCMCGHIRLTVTETPEHNICFCHCTQCRKNYGMYGAFIQIEPYTLILNRPEGITWYTSSTHVERGFCTLCGSGIFWKHREANALYILAGLLDTYTFVHGRHIFMGDKGDYYEVCDEHPKYSADET